MKPLLLTASFFLCVILAACDQSRSSQLVYLVRGPNGGEIIALNPQSRSQRVIRQVNNGEYLGDAGLSPDGKRILFITGVFESQVTNVWVADIDNPAPEKIELDFPKGGLYNFIWVNDEQLVFAGLDPEIPITDPFQWKLYDVTTHELRSLVWQSEMLVNPSVLNHHDRQGLLAYKSRKAYPMIASFHVAGDSLNLVPETEVNPALVPPAVSRVSGRLPANETDLAFDGRGGPNNNDIFLATDHGQTVEQLTNFASGYGVSGIGKVALAPNGEWIAFDVVLGLEHSPDLATGRWLSIVSRDGKTVRHLSEIPDTLYGELLWSADSRYLSVCNVPLGADPLHTGCEVYLIEVETGKIEQLTSDGYSKLLLDWR